MKKTFILIFFLSSIVVSCAPKSAETTTQKVITNTVITSPTVVFPTETIIPTFTGIPSLVPSQTAAITSTPDFSGIRYAGASIVKGQLMLSFRIPELGLPFKATIDGYPFNCKTDNRYPGTLYCLGKFFAAGQKVKVEFSVGDEQKVVKEISVIIPLEAVPTPVTPGSYSNWCPLRGQRVTCDEEYDDDEGVWCLDVTCYDACGYYYSIHKCEPN